MDWETSLLVPALLGVVFFSGAIYAFLWARRQRQFHNLEAGARSIFTPEEPEGAVTDAFPADDKPARANDPAQKTSR